MFSFFQSHLGVGVGISSVIQSGGAGLHPCPTRVFSAAHPHLCLAMFLIIASLMGVEREW